MRTMVCAAALIMAGSALAADEYKLVWSDEFDKPGMPDPAKWDYEEGFVRNRELQYYTRTRRENCRVENGCLVLEARKERFKNPAFRGAAGKQDWKRTREYAEFTSASLITRGKAAWTYGKIEVKAKIPTGRGMWPAIWTLGTNIREVGWPACGEIDILENVGFNPHVIHANIHTRKYNHVKRTGKGSKIRFERPYEDFHRYGIEWTPERIDFYFDDRMYFTYKNEKTGDDVWPYDKDQYLILNIAVGGSWGGQKGIDPSVFPQRMLIDYVRVYQKQ
jgi:beta-glucanase (GH16 family)